MLRESNSFCHILKSLPDARNAAGHFDAAERLQRPKPADSDAHSDGDELAHIDAHAKRDAERHAD